MTQKFKINPNVNTRSLMERHNEVIKMAESRLIDNLVGNNKFDPLTVKTGEYYVQSAYTAIYGKITSELTAINRSLEAIRPFYLTEVILSQITDDALSPMVGSEQIFKYSSKNKKVQKELDLLQENQQLNQLVLNITPDLCFYGEYHLETQVETKSDKIKTARGLVDLKDKVEQGTVISLSRDGKDIGFLSRDRFSGRILYHTPADFIKFSLGGSRIKINLDSWLPEARMTNNKDLAVILDSVPRFLRIGKSVFYGTTSKIRELELLEKLIPATKINKLSQGNIIGITLPNDYDLKTGMQAARELEQLINKKVNVDPQTGEITAEAILSIAGRTRVIPVFGDKGEVQKLDTKADEVDDLTSQTKDLRDLILDSVGVPAELVYKSEADTSKNEILKRYSKYLRKLKRVQKAISEGLKQIACIHLTNMGIDYEEKDIEITFLNAPIEVDNLDRLEFAEATTNMVGNVKNFFGELAAEDSPFRDMVDLDKVAEWMESNFKLVGLADALKLSTEGGAGAIKPSSMNDLGGDVSGEEPVDDETLDDTTTEDDLGVEDEEEPVS